MIAPLEPPDSHVLSAAVGWFELGNLQESKTELSRLSLPLLNHPDVLELRWSIAAQEQSWTECLESAQALIAQAPERASGWLHHAYALRRAPDGGLQQAWDALLPAYEKFPKEPVVAYNLSCYACQMQDLSAARVWFRRAMASGDREAVKRMALHDEDLRAMWAEIAVM